MFPQFPRVVAAYGMTAQYQSRSWPCHDVCTIAHPCSHVCICVTTAAIKRQNYSLSQRSLLSPLEIHPLPSLPHPRTHPSSIYIVSHCENIIFNYGYIFKLTSAIYIFLACSFCLITFSFPCLTTDPSNIF